jgi:predicted ATP-dependent endonuclease of OLD family
VLYSTHSPAFLNVARLHELVLTEHRAETGTRLVQSDPLPRDEEFRANSEFDAARSELFLARAAILVEGLTEQLALPFVFHALGYDPDQLGISIVECGGQPNIPVIARVAKAGGIPFLAVHDRDAPLNQKPNESERNLNQLIGRMAGAHRVELTPDSEGVTGLKGHKHKPERAWRSFAKLKPDEIPKPLIDIVKMAIALTDP